MTDRPAINSRIVSDPGICGGKPIVQGTRVTVSLIVDWIDTGVSTEEILEDFPNLTREDIKAAWHLQDVS